MLELTKGYSMSKRLLLDLRKNANMTQQDVADVLGVTRVTYANIETGARELTLNEIKKLAEYYNISTTEIIDGRLIDTKVIKSVALETNVEKLEQVNKLDNEKFREVLLYILNKVGAKPNVGETVLYKLLYFIDFDYYEQNHTSITGMQYVKNHFGPTPKKMDFDSILGAMKKQHEIELIKTKYATKDQKKYLPVMRPRLTKLSADEIKHIDEVLNRLSNKNATELSELSHKDIPWIASDSNEVIDYDLVFYRTPITARSSDSDVDL